MKKNIKVIGRIVGYWIMCMALFCIISPLIFPFSIWYGFQDVFNVFILFLPIGFMLRLMDFPSDCNKEKTLYITKESFIILMLSNIPALTIAIAYLIKDGKDYHGIIVKTLLIWIIEFIGYTIINEKTIKQEDHESINLLDKLVEKTKELNR